MGAAFHGEILADDADQPSIDLAKAHDDAIGGRQRFEGGRHLRIVRGEPAIFLEAALGEQPGHSLPHVELSLVVLARDAVRAAHGKGACLPGRQFV